VALKLIYLMFAKLLGWMLLRTRSDTCGCPKSRALSLTWCFTAESVGASSADGGEADLPHAREGAELDGAHARSDTTNEIEILVLRHQLADRPRWRTRRRSPAHHRRSPAHRRRSALPTATMLILLDRRARRKPERRALALGVRVGLLARLDLPTGPTVTAASRSTGAVERLT
jgi:hypothetical protein